MLKPRKTKDLDKNRTAFRNAIIRWFKEYGKDYPWRRTTDPYAILVSEVMLQQTTLASVLANKRYELFLEQFPSIQHLAGSTEEGVLAAWEGLGYYRRARNLQACAKAIVDKHKGVFPEDYEEILALPGVGRYTAGAVASFAYNQSQPIVDANIARVLSRVLDLREPVDGGKGQEILWQYAEFVVPMKQSRIFNSGLMELGQTVCTNKNPKCLECPIHSFCKTRKPEVLPKKKKLQTKQVLEEFALFVRKSNGDILLSKQTGKRREGLWMLPLRTKEQCTDFDVLYSSTYAITRYKVKLMVHSCSVLAIPPLKEDLPAEQWISEARAMQIPMPSPYRKAFLKLIES